MHLSNRVVQDRSTLKPEVKEYLSFSPDDMGLLFGDLATPVGLVLNHINPRECFVIFSDPEYVPDILKLVDTPKWVGTHMNVTLDRPRMELIPIIGKFLEDKALEEGEDFEYIPMEAQGSPHSSTPEKGEEPVIPQLAEHIKSIQASELKQILAAISKEMDVRHVPHRSLSKPDASGSQAHEVSSILHSLIKEGPLRTNITKLSMFSGEMMKGEASFEQWPYELQTLRRTYSESALREGIQRSLKGLQQIQSILSVLMPPWTPSSRHLALFMSMLNLMIF